MMDERQAINIVRGLGILYFIGAGLFFFVAFLALLTNYQWVAQQWRFYISFSFFIALGVLYLYLGRDLRRFRRWARIVTLVFAWYGALSYPLAWILALFGVDIAIGHDVFSVTGIILSIFFVWFFQFNPVVKELFKNPPPSEIEPTLDVKHAARLAEMKNTKRPEKKTRKKRK